MGLPTTESSVLPGAYVSRARPRQPDRRPHRLQRGLRPAAGDRPRLPRAGASRATDGRRRPSLARPRPATSTSRPTAAPTPPTVEPAWGRYAAGVVRALAERGREPAGIDADGLVDGPAGAGLSSSAALEVALALALCDAAGFSLPPLELAQACQEAEHVATGVPVRDHGPARLARRAARPRAPDRLPQPRDRADPAAAAARRARDPLGLSRAARRQRLRRAAADVRDGGRPARPVRPCGTRRPSRSPTSRAPATSSPRTRACSRRPAPSRQAPSTTLGPLLAASHASLRDDFEVSTPELDALVEELVDGGRARRTTDRRRLRRLRRRAREP